MKACCSYSSLSLAAVIAVLVSLNTVKSTEAKASFLPQTTAVSKVITTRGGSSTTTAVVLDETDDDPEFLKRVELLQKYRMDQQMLMQLRSTILSEALASRGLSSMTTLVDVSTAEGDKPPEPVDWDCAMSTEEEPKTCLYSFDAEPNTKVIAPLGTTQWISLSALNRLRRTDPSKVEPMWHSQFAIMKSWFGTDSEYSVVPSSSKGLALSLLLDQTIVLKGLITAAVLLFGIIFLPLFDFLINRCMVSSTLWMSWPQWARVVHAALPLKLLLGQMAWKFMAKIFGKVEQRVKDMLVELECATLEDTIPLTVGPGSEVVMDEEELDLVDTFQSDSEDDSDGSEDSTFDIDSDED